MAWGKIAGKVVNPKVQHIVDQSKILKMLAIKEQQSEEVPEVEPKKRSSNTKNNLFSILSNTVQQWWWHATCKGVAKK